MGRLPGQLPASVHGYVLALGGRLPYTCTTNATLPPLTDDLPILLGLRE